MSTQTTSKKDQYTLWQILGIWALTALPMALLEQLIATRQPVLRAHPAWPTRVASRVGGLAVQH